MPQATKLVGGLTGIPGQAAHESTVFFATILSSRRPVTCLFLPLATETKQSRDVIVPGKAGAEETIVEGGVWCRMPGI